MTLALLLVALQSAAIPRPTENYAMCLRVNAAPVAEGGSEAEWRAGWRSALAACQPVRQQWARWHFLSVGGPSRPNDAAVANNLEQMMMQDDARLYERYRNPGRVTTYVDRFIAPEEPPRARD